MTNKPEFVRVRDTKTGAHLTIRQGRIDRNPKRYTPLEGHAAVDINGKPLPPKPQQSKAEPVDGQAKTTKKES